MPPVDYHLIIGPPDLFTTALHTALEQQYGPEHLHWSPDMTEGTRMIEQIRPSIVYYGSNAFPEGITGHPATYWHQHARDLLQVLNLARQYRFRLFYPSSIAVFGNTAPSERCSNGAPQDPMGMFALCKRAAERWCEQYHDGHGVDVRSLRFPVLIGTQRRTAQEPATLSPGWMGQTRPVLPVEEAVRATIELMAAPAAAIRQRRSYNLNGITVALGDLAAELHRHRPDMALAVWNLPDHPGPVSFDETAACTDWGWRPRYDLLTLVRRLLHE